MNPDSGEGVRVIRWVALVALVANVIHNGFSARDDASLPSIGEVSDSYQAAFTPADYAFSIWSAIYLGFLVYAVVALLPSQRTERAHDRLAVGLIVYSALGVLWAELFRRHEILGSLVTIVGMFITGAYLFGASRSFSAKAGLARWLTVPFGLFYGWITVATLANLAVWMRTVPAMSGADEQVFFAVAMIVAAAVAALLVSTRFRDGVYPAVIVWALVAIWVRQNEGMPVVSAVALAGAGIALVAMILPWSLREPFRSGSAPSRT